MKVSLIVQRIVAFGANPWTILASVVIGCVLGRYFPVQAERSSIVGKIYLDLLQMVMLPFLLSSVTMGLARILRERKLAVLASRLVLVFAVSLFLAAATGIVVAEAFGAGDGLSQDSRNEMGRMIVEARTDDIEVSLSGGVVETPERDIRGIIRQLVPGNVFNALSNGDTLKVMVFTLLFGMAVGRVPGRDVDVLLGSLQAVFDASQKVMRWVNGLIPLALCSMVAEQAARLGFGSVRIMGTFLGANLVASGLLWGIYCIVMWRRSGADPLVLANALKEPVMIAAGTRNSLASIPSSIAGLVDDLGFRRELVELLTPLGVTLGRLGPISFFGVSGIFVAQMYGISLSLQQILFLLAGSVLVGIASAGASGVLTVSMLALVCRPLGLPCDAAIVLFVAVDVVNGLLRSVTNVLGACAMVAVVCPARDPEDVAEPDELGGVGVQA